MPDRGLAERVLANGAEGEHLLQAERALRDAIAAASRAPANNVGGVADPLPLIALADVLRRQRRLAEADEQSSRALRMASGRPGHESQHAFALLVQAQIELALGNRHGARRYSWLARRAIDDARGSSKHQVSTEIVEHRLAHIDEGLRRPQSRPLPGSEPTEAERVVLILLTTTLSRTQIAAALGMSPSTVKAHLHRLYQRLDAIAREEAIEKARERGLL